MSFKKNVLAVGANSDFKKSIASTLDRQHLSLWLYDEPEPLIAHAATLDQGVIIIWSQQQGMRCSELVRYLNQHYPQLFLIVIARETAKQRAIEMVHAGAAEYLVHPVEPMVLCSHIERLIAPGSPGHNSHQLIARAPSTLQTLRLARRAAESDASVLIEGESGTGKEMLARFVHDNSPRRNQAFVAVNCAAIPESMLESILFGHEKGAFTGAISRYAGKFEQASGGTLFLDEVAEMPLNQQAKLLRVLQEREVERLGRGQPVKVDIRVVVATNRNLARRVQQGLFREDLFYRLNVFPLQLAPLRTRREDILPLARYFLQKLGTPPGQPGLDLSQDAEEALISHDWPGNIRELENVIQRAAILRRSWVIMKNDLLLPAPLKAVQENEQSHQIEPAQAQSEDPVQDLTKTPELLPGSPRKQQEWLHVIEVLKRHGGHRGRSARELGLSTRMLRYKLAQLRSFGIDINSAIASANRVTESPEGTGCPL